MSVTGSGIDVGAGRTVGGGGDMVTGVVDIVDGGGVVDRLSSPSSLQLKILLSRIAASISDMSEDIVELVDMRHVGTCCVVGVGDTTRDGGGVVSRFDSLM